jgi:hypothetical protein
VASELFDLDLLDEEDSFEIDAQAAHAWASTTFTTSGRLIRSSTLPNRPPIG